MLLSQLSLRTNSLADQFISRKIRILDERQLGKAYHKVNFLELKMSNLAVGIDLRCHKMLSLQ